MTSWIRRRVASDRVRLPLRAYHTLLRDTAARRAISPMFSARTPCLARLLRWTIRCPFYAWSAARMDVDKPEGQCLWSPVSSESVRFVATQANPGDMIMSRSGLRRIVDLSLAAVVV